MCCRFVEITNFYSVIPKSFGLNLKPQSVSTWSVWAIGSSGYRGDADQNHLRRYGFGNELVRTFFASDYRLIWEELGICWKIEVIFVEITTLKYDVLTGQLQKA
jgi:hypothetical protein